MSANVVIIDFDWAGHIPSYHILWSQALMELGYKVLSYSPRPSDVERLLGSTGNIICRGVNSSSGKLASSLRAPRYLVGLRHTVFYRMAMPLYFWGYASNLVKSCGVNFHRVLFPFLDQKLISYGVHQKIVDFLFPFPWSGLYVAPLGFRSSKTGSLTTPRDLRYLSLFKAKNFKSLGILDEGIHQEISKILSPKPVEVFPDVVMDPLKEPIATSKGISEMTSKARGRKIVLLIGEISKKKGINEFLELSNQCSHLPFFFVVAGPLDDKSTLGNDLVDLQGRLSESSPTSNQYFHLERIERNQDYDAWVKAADYIYAYYPSYYYSSNTLTKAALYSKPALVNFAGLLGQRVQKYQTGVPTTGNAGSQVKDLLFLDQLTTQGFFKPQYFQSYLANHSFERLKNSLSLMLNN